MLSFPQLCCQLGDWDVQLDEYPHSHAIGSCIRKGQGMRACGRGLDAARGAVYVCAPAC